jgi:hypothetical protein
MNLSHSVTIAAELMKSSLTMKAFRISSEALEKLSKGHWPKRRRSWCSFEWHPLHFHDAFFLDMMRQLSKVSKRPQTPQDTLPSKSAISARLSPEPAAGNGTIATWTRRLSTLHTCHSGYPLYTKYTAVLRFDRFT